MVSAAMALGTGAATTAAHPFSLFVGGLDLIRGGLPGASYGNPLEAISVAEAADGSTMDFAIDDPALELNFAGGEEVLFWDHALGDAIFGGKVDVYAKSPDFGNRGRTWEIKCVDWQTLRLDRLRVPLDARPGGHTRQDHIQYFVGQYGRDLLALGRQYVPGPPAETDGSLADGTVGTTYNGLAATPTAVDPFTVAGSSLRDALAQVGASSYDLYAGLALYADPVLFVDFQKRVWYGTDGVGFRGSGPTLTDSPNPANRAPADLRYEVDRGPMIDRVYIKGANAAGTGWVGVGESEDYTEITDSDSAAKLASYGQDYLNKHGAVVRGSYTVSGADVGGLHTFMSQSLTNTAIGLAGTVVISSVATTFDGGAGHRTVAVTFGGGLPASAVKLLRRYLARP